MALEHFARLAQEFFFHAGEEAKKHRPGAPVGERKREVMGTARENLQRSKPLWYRVRDEVVAGNKIFLCTASEHGPEKLYAPESVLDFNHWFTDQFLGGHTFYVEQADGTAVEIGTADPVHVH